MRNVDVAIVGGGPAGMAAALSAAQNGAEKVLIIERDVELGGILQHCIHNGFGLHLLRQEMTGPGYANVFINRIKQESKIEVMLDTMVLNLTPGRRLTVVNPAEGVTEIEAKAVVLAMGCRERARGAIRTPGARAAGVFSAGVAQRMVNIEGYLPGKNVVIIGSGDIGLIMAKRLSLEGAKVKAVLEIMPHSNGLTRNIVQCLDDFGIPLRLSRSVTKIHGQQRVTGLTHALVDAEFKIVPGTEEEIECDCVLFSVGLIPENELSREIGLEFDKITLGPCVDQFRQTSAAGFFAAGNVLHVHDLVDYVSLEGETAGKGAALYAQGLLGEKTATVPVKKAAGVRSVVPQEIAAYPGAEACSLYIRASEIIPGAVLEVSSGGRKIAEKKLLIARPSEMIVIEVAETDFTEPVEVALRKGE
ncbi:MAG: NAD(P)/FAD-dependent oxidoreductase [Sporomusaceae bacterium]|jgi:NADPH-dependent 2,4-dienoyl-CoA reductase/sulfur reductase-like enzyme|nr:NAD(P)/FAD-dependent oxidoreductase [Sporomusaceae bacterium]